MNNSKVMIDNNIIIFDNSLPICGVQKKTGIFSELGVKVCLLQMYITRKKNMSTYIFTNRKGKSVAKLDD